MNTTQTHISKISQKAATQKYLVQKSSEQPFPRRRVSGINCKLVWCPHDPCGACSYNCSRRTADYIKFPNKIQQILCIWCTYRSDFVPLHIHQSPQAVRLAFYGILAGNRGYRAQDCYISSKHTFFGCPKSCGTKSIFFGGPPVLTLFKTVFVN